jgi:hypothetical protein
MPCLQVGLTDFDPVLSLDASQKSGISNSKKEIIPHDFEVDSCQACMLVSHSGYLYTRHCHPRMAALMFIRLV